LVGSTLAAGKDSAISITGCRFTSIDAVPQMKAPLLIPDVLHGEPGAVGDVVAVIRDGPARTPPLGGFDSFRFQGMRRARRQTGPFGWSWANKIRSVC
jgi:hypothetical protein